MVKYPPQILEESPGHFMSHDASVVLDDKGGATSPQKHSELKTNIYVVNKLQTM